MTSLQSAGQDGENVQGHPVVYYLLPMGGRVVCHKRRTSEGGIMAMWAFDPMRSLKFFSQGYFSMFI